MTEPRGLNEISGWLSKWTNILGGYQKRWFVLSNGTLRYYKNREETALTCRGTISLAHATVDFDETCKFIISNKGYAYHVKADSQDDKYRWIEALTAATQAPPITDKAATPETASQVSFITEKSIQNNIGCDTQQAMSMMNSMKKKLNDIRACVDLITSHGAMLQDAITNLQNSTHEEDLIRDVSDLAAIFQATALSLANACTDYLEAAESQSTEWISLFQFEQEQRVKLGEIVQSLTQAQSQSKTSSLDDELEYFDCSDTEFNLPDSTKLTMQVYQVRESTSNNEHTENITPLKQGISVRRTRIQERPNVSANLWSILKNCIGKDLTKMPLPVAFAEPLSLLQRLTENFEYSDLLDKAGKSSADVATQLVYIAAFVASTYSTTISRTGKPFNPLLGETYECDRMGDLGWKSIAEQVSHHPPVAAVHCQGKSWQIWMEESVQTKFRGATVYVTPQGECHLKFKEGNRFSWKKPTTCIHNVIIGKLWVEQEGDVEIKCFTSDVTCRLNFMSAGWFGETWSVKGLVKDGSGKPAFEIWGKYSTQIEYKQAGTKQPGTVIWKRTDPLPDSPKFYHFTLLACQLNEMEPGVAPTDSRNRPDQRLMEEGKFDEANVTKKKLEDWQRVNKKQTWTPAWFTRQTDQDTGTEMWSYAGDYWSCKAKKDWTRCPAYIFNLR